MRRILLLGTVGLVFVVSAAAFLMASADPPTPKIEMATPENMHGHMPASVTEAHVGTRGQSGQPGSTPANGTPPAGEIRPAAER
jgi:hypothetical protein